MREEEGPTNTYRDLKLLRGEFDRRSCRFYIAKLTLEETLTLTCLTISMKAGGRGW